LRKGKLLKRLIAALLTALVASLALPALAAWIVDLASHASLQLSEKLQGFKDLLVYDGTLIKLNDLLAEKFPCSRHKAELKIRLTIGLTGNTKSVALFSGKTNELKTIRIGSWVKNNILLFDLGFFKYEVFSRIRKFGGHFVSRVKTGVNPTIVSVLKTHRGNTIDLAGKKLQDVLPRLKREALDCLVEVEFKASASRARKSDKNGFEVYRTRGGAAKIKETFRLVGMLDRESGEYHLYLTDIMPERLSAEDIALLYRARWSIEMVFKEFKRLYKLDELPSNKPVVIKSLVMVSMLTLVVSHRILNIMRNLIPEKSERFTPLRWAETFYASASELLDQVLALEGIYLEAFTILMFYSGEGIDPNVNRERLLSPWVRAANYQLKGASN
jgi:IS4 transposase